MMIADEDTCAICDDPVSTTSNQIIYCDGKDCNMPVHQRCYGVAEIPEGDWLCQRCRAAKFKKRVVVICCPMQTGPLQRLNKDSNEYIHVTCAMLNKDVDQQNRTYTLRRNAINRNTCCFCNKKQGLCIECGNKECSKCFHVTCGVNAGVITLRPSMLPNQPQFCIQHLPSDPINNIKKTQSPSTPTIPKTVPMKRHLPGQQDVYSLGDSEDSDDAMGSALGLRAKKQHLHNNDNERDRPRPLNPNRPTLPSSKAPAPRQITALKTTYSSAIHPSITPSSDTSTPNNTGPTPSHPSSTTLSSSDDKVLLAEKQLEEANKEIKRLNQELERHEDFRQKVAKIFMSLNISTTNGTFPTNENTEHYINIMHDTLERVGPPTNQEWSDIAKFSKALANRRPRHH